MPLSRISKVHELLPDQIVERALDAKSPFDAAGRPALLYPDLVELYAAHVATIRVGLSRAQKKCAISFVRGLRSKRRILLISLMNFPCEPINRLILNQLVSALLGFSRAARDCMSLILKMKTSAQSGAKCTSKIDVTYLF